MQAETLQPARRSTCVAHVTRSVHMSIACEASGLPEPSNHSTRASNEQCRRQKPGKSSREWRVKTCKTVRRFAESQKRNPLHMQGLQLT
jgi:hypothetical protein